MIQNWPKRRYTVRMSTGDVTRFEDVQADIIPILNKRLETLGLNDPQGFSIVGVTTHFIQDDIGNDAPVNIGGRNMPVVMVVGNATGIVHYFAFRSLMRELEKIKKSDQNGAKQ